MDQEMVQTVANELVKLSREIGNDESGDRKFKIPANPAEAMNFINKFSWNLADTFSIDDKSVVNRVRKLVSEGYRNVWAVHNTATLKYEIYIRPDKLSYSELDSMATSQNSSSSKGGCFIATAVYDSPFAPEVLFLKKFRDNELLQRWYGRLFVHIYYKISPSIANLLQKQTLLKNIVKAIFIKPIIDLIKSKHA